MHSLISSIVTAAGDVAIVFIACLSVLIIMNYVVLKRELNCARQMDNARAHPQNTQSKGLCKSGKLLSLRQPECKPAAMAKLYLQDLRDRTIAAFDDGESRPDCVINLMQRRETTGASQPEKFSEAGPDDRPNPDAL
jgi:hypothetical protein